MESKYEDFGKALWKKIMDVPFDSYPKTGLELINLRAAIDADLVRNKPNIMTSELCLSITRAHSYLTGLALR